MVIVAPLLRYVNEKSFWLSFNRYISHHNNAYSIPVEPFIDAGMLSIDDSTLRRLRVTGVMDRILSLYDSRVSIPVEMLEDSLIDNFNSGADVYKWLLSSSDICALEEVSTDSDTLYHLEVIKGEDLS